MSIIDADEPDLVEVIVRLPRALLEATVREARPWGSDPRGRRLALAKWVLAIRRRRAKTFNGRVRLGEPSWDMILDLYIADHDGRRVDVSGLCLASGVGPTTALRYVDLLVDDELIAKSGDEHDGRRWFVNISDALRTAIDDWLDYAEAALGVAGWTAPPDPISDHEGDADREHSR